MGKYTVTFKPGHALQEQWDASTARYKVGAWGRQSGKSTGCNRGILKRLLREKNKTYWFIAPTYNQALLQYRRSSALLWPARSLITKKNQTELRLKLVTGSQVFYKSGDRPDNLRAETLDGVVIDEVRDQDPDLWPMVIRPMLATTGGWAEFISTCNGYDEFYDLAEIARNDKSGKWAYFHAPSWVNPSWTEEEIQECRNTMTEAQFAQEILAEFRDIQAGKAYVNYSSDRNESPTSPITTNGEISPHLPIIVAADFNLSPMAWTLGQQRGEGLYFHDEIVLENSHTQEAASELVNRVKAHPAGVLICGDATAKAGQRAAAGESDYDILCQTLSTAGIKWVNRTPNSNPHIRDRVNAVNAKLLSASGKVSLWHHPRTVMLRKDFERVTWKVGAMFILDPGKKRMLTHSTDGVGYAVCELGPVPSRVQVGGIRVIRR